ncbi:hypothetical protein D3C72_1197370 [compost metagenome]
MGGFDLAVGDLAALVSQAVGGEILGVDEAAIGGADGPLGELIQPGAVLQPIGQFLTAVGLQPAFGRLQQAAVTPIGRAPRQGVHDLEHLFGVVLVRHQPAHGAQRTDGLHA